MSDYIIAPSKHDPIGKNEIIYAYLVIVPPCTLTSGDNVYEQPSEMYIKIGKVGRGGKCEPVPQEKTVKTFFGTGHSRGL